MNALRTLIVVMTFFIIIGVSGAGAQGNQGVNFDLCPLINDVVFCPFDEFGHVYWEPADEPGNPVVKPCGLNGCYYVLPSCGTIGCQVEYKAWGGNSKGELKEWAVSIFVGFEGVAQYHPIAVPDQGLRTFLPAVKNQPEPIFTP